MSKEDMDAWTKALLRDMAIGGAINIKRAEDYALGWNAACAYKDKRIAELEAEKAQVCEWSCKDSDIMLYGGTCGTEWVFDQPPVGDYNYCPKCGRHLHISEGGAE